MPAAALPRPRVDVVIPFAGSAAELAELLARCGRLRRRPKDSITVVDNRRGSEPPAEVPVPEGPSVIAAQERPGSYFARNRGAAEGDAEWLVFLDADVEPGPDLLDRYFAHPPAAGTAVLVGSVDDELPVAGETAVARFLHEKAAMSQSNTVRGESAYAQTANCAVRRSAFEGIGGFREDIRSGGDADLCFRLERAGWGLEVRDGARARHRTRTTLRAMTRQRARHGSGAAWLNRAYPGMFPPSPALGLGRWSAASALGAARRLLKGDRPGAARAVLEPIFAGSFELGRLLPNTIGAGAPEGGLRLAVLTDAYPVVSETFVTDEVAELRRQGHAVVVEASARSDRPDPTSPATMTSYLEDDPRLGKLFALATMAARHPGAVGRDLLARRRWRREEEVRPLRALALRARRLRAAGVSHLHVHFAANAALDAMRLAAIEGLPYSVTAHAVEIFESPANLREKLERAAFATTGCEYNARHLRSVVGSGSRAAVHVVVMGVDPEAFRRSSAYPGGRSVVAVGRLVEKKGFTHLIGATAELEAEVPLERATIVGDGPLRGNLAAQIERLDLGERVELAGRLGPREIREVLEGADLLAMPCVIATGGDRDSMPVVVKEAMAMEVPVVASDEVGLPELVDAEVGRLVPPGDRHALAEGIRDLLELAPVERTSLGEAGRRRVIERCNLRRETARLAELIAAARGCAQARRRDGGPRPTRRR